MATETYRHRSTLYLHVHAGREEELPALYEIRVETFPAEPYSWGAGRGEELEIIATLIGFIRHGQQYTRKDAIEIAGLAEIVRQEEITAECWDWAAPGEDAFTPDDCLPMAAE